LTILFTPTGRQQFLEAIAYIHRDKPSAAVTFRQKVEKTLPRLKKFPESGRQLPEFPELPFREVYNGPRNLDSVLSYTWEQKRGGPSG